MQKRFLPPANEVCEGYVFTGVCLSTGGGGMHGCSGGVCVVARGGVHGCSGGCAWLLQGGHVWFYLGGMRGFISGGMRGFIQGGMCGFIWGACVVLFGGACVVLFGGRVWFYSGGHAWFFQFFQIQWDTVNERAVRILLECILVLFLLLPFGTVHNHFCSTRELIFTPETSRELKWIGQISATICKLILALWYPGSFLEHTRPVSGVKITSRVERKWLWTVLLWTLNWILCEPIWKRCRFRFCFRLNISEPL